MEGCERGKFCELKSAMSLNGVPLQLKHKNIYNERRQIKAEKSPEKPFRELCDE